MHWRIRHFRCRRWHEGFGAGHRLWVWQRAVWGAGQRAGGCAEQLYVDVVIIRMLSHVACQWPSLSCRCSGLGHAWLGSAGLLTQILVDQHWLFCVQHIWWRGAVYAVAIQDESVACCAEDLQYGASAVDAADYTDSICLVLLCWFVGIVGGPVEYLSFLNTVLGYEIFHGKVISSYPGYCFNDRLAPSPNSLFTVIFKHNLYFSFCTFLAEGNFDKLGCSALVMFQVLTTSNWQGLNSNVMDTYQTRWTAPFFMTRFWFKIFSLSIFQSSLSATLFAAWLLRPSLSEYSLRRSSRFLSASVFKRTLHYRHANSSKGKSIEC